MDWEAFYNSFRKPDFIAGYEIQNRLGGGAFGDVYKARKQSIGKAYAIKFLKLEDDGQREAVERELAQVRHFAAIDHPNLVTIEDMGTTMDVPYLIMGYAGEDTLARRLKGGALSSEDALLYFTQACRGVLALHDRRLVHFDLKPSNIFLKGEVARVGDYGLSKLLTDGRMTLSFGRGTPQYMAPEILRSRADHRADIYSLGVILYESLVGRLPFEPEAEGGLILREEDTPPEFPDDFPGAMRPAVERCLRLAADDRYDDVGELLEALGQTARQGDSVTLPLKEVGSPVAHSATPARVSTSSTSEPDEPPTPKPGSELRQTAAELARGAAMVARGVWDGLRSTGVEEPPPPPPADSPPGPVTLAKPSDLRKAGKDVRGAGIQVKQAVANVKTALGESRDKLKAGHAAASHKARSLVDGLRRKPSGSTGAPGNPSSVPAARAAGGPRTGPVPAPAPGGAVPVPPRVEGGFLGTLTQTAVVGAEVLVALVGNLLRGLARGFRAIADLSLRRSGSWLGRVVGVVGFLTFMALLGFLVMLVGMVFLDAVGVRT